MTNGYYMLEVMKRGHVYIQADSEKDAEKKFEKNPNHFNIEWEEDISDEPPFLTGLRTEYIG